MAVAEFLTGFEPSWLLVAGPKRWSPKTCVSDYSEVSMEKHNITAELALAWPCQLQEYEARLSPLLKLGRFLLHYGTITIVCSGLLFNLLIIITLSRKTVRQNTSYMYLLALAIYDSSVLIFNFMVGVLRAQNPDTINRAFQEKEWLCLCHSVLVELFNLLSVWMIVCFTVERLIAVEFPLKVHRLCSVKRTRATIVSVSIAILLISMHKVFISGFEGDSVFGYKACHTNRRKFQEAIYVYVTINTWFPAITMGVLNSVIIYRIHKSARVRRKMSLKVLKSRKTGEKRQMRTNWMLIATSIIFLGLLLPLGAVQMTELLIRSDSPRPSAVAEEQQAYIRYAKQALLLKSIRCLCFFFYQLNFGINLFIYLLTNVQFRRIFFGNFPGLVPDWLREHFCIQSSFITQNGGHRETIDSSVELTTLSTVSDKRSSSVHRDSLSLCVERSSSVHRDSLSLCMERSSSVHRHSLSLCMERSSSIHRDSLSLCMNRSSSVHRASLSLCVERSSSIHRDSLSLCVERSSSVHRDSLSLCAETWRGH
ncbi:probable G-protein coupled receptor B0563.6 [Watersipora subatra]|uniref:probable G-protein coupled receptor B0563.6 n=1 Tax=Watersipora subatra TaxID=2589382 RepID=UPI00355B728B